MRNATPAQADNPAECHSLGVINVFRKLALAFTLLCSLFVLPAVAQNATVNSQPAQIGASTTVNSTQCALGSSCIISSTAQHIAGSEIFLNMLPQYISGSTLTDSSGNGNNGTLCTGANAPTETLLGLFFGSSGSCVSLPSAVNNLRTFEFVINIPTNYNPGPNTSIITPSSNSSGAPIFFLSGWEGSGNEFTVTPGVSLWKYGGPVSTGSQVYLSAGNHVITITLGTNCTSDKSHIYYDGQEINPYLTQGCEAGTATAYNWILGGGPFAAASPVTQYEFLGWSSELTQTQIQQEVAASTSDLTLRGAGSIGLQWSGYYPNFFAYGDSLTACYEISNYADCWVNQPPSPVPTFFIYNFGNPGKNADYIMSMDAGQAEAGCNSNQGPSIAAIWDGTNNFLNNANATAANVAGYIANQVAILRQAGCAVFVGTMISRGNGYGSPANGASWSTNQQSLDLLIRQNWKAWGASGLMDFAADPNLGCAACNTNTTYYQTDNTHLTNAGYLLTQSAAWQTIEYYFGSSKSNPHFITNAAVSGVIPGTLTATGVPGNYALVNSNYPLAPGTIGSIQMQFYTAPSGSDPITLALATGSGNTFTFVSGSTFTVTPAANTSLQTFVAGTGFTGAPTVPSTGGPYYLAEWAPTVQPGQGGSGGWVYLASSLLPSGAQTYSLASTNIALTATITSSSYSMLASDDYIEYNGTAGYSFTLPSCVGQSGAEYAINNQTSYTITLKNLNSTQPINGTDYSTTGLTLPSTGTFKITDVPNVLGTTAGCHWSY
jgi:hypothetical protein